MQLQTWWDVQVTFNYGKKITFIQKVRDKNRNGIYIWKYKKQTSYTCRVGNNMVQNDSSVLMHSETDR